MSVLQRLERIFRDILGDDSLELADATTAADVPGWDSFAHVNLMFSVEEEFGFQFVGNQFAEFANIGELRRFLEARGAA